MSRVALASTTWGTFQDTAGNALAGSVSVTIKNLDGTAATHWSAATGGSSATTAITTDSNGQLPRWIEAGDYLIDVPALSITGQRVPASSGADVAVLKEAPMNIRDDVNGGMVGDGSNETAKFLIAKGRLPTEGGRIYFPPSDGSGYYINADTMDFSDFRSLTLSGDGGVSAGASPASWIKIRNNGTFGLRAASGVGFVFEKLALTYDASFTGDLVQIRQAASLAAPQMTVFRDFMLGDGGSGLAECLLNLWQAVNVTCDGEWTMHGAKRAIKGTQVGAASTTNYSNAVRFIGGRIKTAISPILNPGFPWTFIGTTFQQCVGGITDPVLGGGAVAAGAAGGIIAETGIPATNVTMVGCGFWDSVLASGGKWVDLSRTPVSNTASTTHAFTFIGGLASNADVQFDLTGCKPAIVEGVQWGSSNTRRVTYGRFGGNVVLGGDTNLDSVNLDGQINMVGTANQYIANQLMSVASTMMLSRISGDAQDRFALQNTGRQEFGSGAAVRDTFTGRQGTGLWGTETGSGITIGTGTTGGGGYLQMFEQTTDPLAPATNGARLFFRDNGSGKTQTCVKYADGSVAVLHTQV